MIVYFLLLLLMTLLGAFAGYFMKLASNASSIWKLVTNRWLYAGAALYGLAAIINIYVLGFLDYTVVLPMTSLTYIYTLFISRIFLDEKISLIKVAGILLIISGAFLTFQFD